MLYRFKGGSDGQYPQGLLAINGVLYATTYIGGSGKCALGCGTIFKMDASGEKTVLYDLSSAGRCRASCAPSLCERQAVRHDCERVARIVRTRYPRDAEPSSQSRRDNEPISLFPSSNPTFRRSPPLATSHLYGGYVAIRTRVELAGTVASTESHPAPTRSSRRQCTSDCAARHCAVLTRRHASTGSQASRTERGRCLLAALR